MRETIQKGMSDPMVKTQFSTEQLVDRWEDQRDIKNLMGKYMNYLIMNMDGQVFDDLWAQERNDVCLGFNDGWYVGAGAVSGYYEAYAKRHALVAEVMQKKFPKPSPEGLGDKSPEDIYGIGTFRSYPIIDPVIKIAVDGKTAKGLWYCQGSHALVTEAGPTSSWTWGYYAADFVRENDNWKLWHLQATNDVECRCGTSWGMPAEPLPELPEFAALKEFKMPPYTTAAVVRMPYTPTRPLVPAPAMPEDYTTFADTFSYGI